MIWINWRKRMNVVPIVAKDVLVPNQKLIIDSNKGYTFNATFIKREGLSIIIKTAIPQKMQRKLNPLEQPYRFKTTHDDIKFKKTMKLIDEILKEIIRLEPPKHNIKKNLDDLKQSSKII